MKIDYAIMAVDDNPLYSDFWEPVSKCWRSMGITPILFYFGNKKSFSDEDYVIRQSFVDGIPHALQTLFIRYYGPKLLDKDKVSIISDIDMLPLSEYYFIEQISGITDDKHVHLNPCMSTYGRVPSCYHVAKNSTFVKTFELDRFLSFKESLEYCLTFQEQGHTTGWFADENFATKMFEKNPDNIVLVPRKGGQNGHRIDRASNDHWALAWDEDLISEQHYYDCHSIRPYQRHKGAIDLIVNRFTQR